MLHFSNSCHSVCLSALYRPPSSHCTNFLAQLKENLGELSNEAHLRMAGDLNIDTLRISKSFVCEFVSLLAENGIIPTILSPARDDVLNGNLVSSCLDHVNVRVSHASIHCAVILQKLPDHYFVACKYAFISKAVQDFEGRLRLGRFH